MNQPFVIERTYNAPAERVWQAITSKEQMKEWYFDIADFKPEIGFEFRFTGSDGDKEFLHLCRVTEVITNKKLTHTWQYEGQEEETFVTWELFAEGNTTRVRLTHEGLEKIAKYGPTFAKENFEAGWNDIVGNLLKSYVEKPGK